MKFSYKIAKIFTGEAVVSARRCLRQWRHRRPPFQVEVDRLIKSVDGEGFRRIARRYGVPNPGSAPPKYLELRHWMEINLRRVRELELDLSRPKRILDLGCGVGYFLHLCRQLGHDVLGLDLDEQRLFNEMVELLRIPRVVWRIEPFVPLPHFGGKFDLITAHLICFNGHKTDRLWQKEEWKFFLDDVALHLQPDGRVALELNHEADGRLYTDELKAFFEQRGAHIHTQRVIFDPLSLSSASPRTIESIFLSSQKRLSARLARSAKTSR
ncbi:MAG: class I SAM-dependent methyltransferase [Verrucomicrobiota bacterium]|nr:class I SAM-dependent methyltransferase [Verrucomicrobiota bacterium]